ncbi:uncharacterized protein RJT20DRAFT_50592 [Scheffersomyces xylosifermentans]|uniref:uncharacterized protein n=1 Tax=Scheffersomyces xylosifermentans TaxID=1304137 RepID=UPI00315CFDED
MPQPINPALLTTNPTIRTLQNKQAILENLRFLLFIMLPIFTAIYFVPSFINPFTIEEFKTNFKVVLLSKPFCEVKPTECAKLLDPNYGNINILKRKTFQHFDLIYVRHRWVEIWDNILLSVLTSRPMKKFALFVSIVSLDKVENPEEYWLKWEESMEIVIAIGNSLTFHTIRGLIVSRMWVFFIFGSIITIGESWATIGEQLSYVLRSATNVF